MKNYFLFLIAALLFLTGAILWSNSLRKEFSDRTVADEVSKNLLSEINSLKKEMPDGKTDQWPNLNHLYFLVEKNHFKKWSAVNSFIDASDIQGNFEWKLIHNPINDLLVYKRLISDSACIVGVLPLRTGYRLTNQYLTTSFNRKIFSIDELEILPIELPQGSWVCVDEIGCLFRIKISQNVKLTNLVSVYLILIAITLTLAFVVYWVKELTNSKKYFSGFCTLFLSMALLRIAMVSLSFPSIWVYSKYFDPRFFASSSFNASVADFFLNSLIVVISSVYFLYTFSKSDWLKILIRSTSAIRFICGSLFLTGSFFSFLFPHLFIESIFHDSSIDLDISKNVQFDEIKLLAMGAFALGCVSSFCFVHCSIRIASSVLNLRGFISAFVLSIFLFAGYFIFSELNYEYVLSIAAIYFLFLYFAKLYRHLIKFSYPTFIYLTTAVVSYSVMGAIDIRKYSDERAIKGLLRSASRLAGNDELGEYLMDQARLKIANDLFIVSAVENPLLSKKMVRQKITQLYLGDYFDRYELGINLFHADGSPADIDSKIDFASSIKSIQATANKTNYESIYWIQSKDSRSLKRYVLIVPLMRNSSTEGYVVLDLNLKRFFSERVYPELLSDRRVNQSTRNSDFSYALYEEQNRIDQSGSFNFEQNFNKALLKYPELYSTGMKDVENLFAGEEDDVGRKIVLVTKASSVFSLVANFSFFFVLGLLVILVFLILFNKSLFAQKSLKFSTRIRVFSYLSLVVPMVAISAIAVRMIVKSSNEQIQKEIEYRGNAISETLRGVLERNSPDSSFRGLKEMISGTTQITNIDANLYSTRGELVASSQPLIFSNQLLMPLADPNALQKIVNENGLELKVKNKVGLLEYSSSYFSIRSKTTGKLLGILELPFFNSQNDVAESSVISNILVTFTVVFVFFSFFSFRIMKSLTSPLLFLTKKLSATSLSVNLPIEWRSDDEIGGLVKQYNQMIKNLEQSKLELARQQKESAWREIAKQVAHEIKNPLTPMKLTLQQMEMTFLKGSLSNDKTLSAIRTLLTQVDTLDGIAESFSVFASLPTPVMEGVDLVDTLDKTILLFQNHSLGKVIFIKPTNKVFINADERLLGRIVSNIVLNALQSDYEKHLDVEVGVKDEDGFAKIYIKDNGPGILPEFRDKIFLPHFSTKATGSGLGLAIAKQGVEQMGGSISFETTQDSGTCFYIKLKNS